MQAEKTLCKSIQAYMLKHRVEQKESKHRVRTEQEQNTSLAQRTFVRKTLFLHLCMRGVLIWYALQYAVYTTYVYLSIIILLQQLACSFVSMLLINRTIRLCCGDEISCLSFKFYSQRPHLYFSFKTIFILLSYIFSVPSISGKPKVKQKLLVKQTHKSWASPLISRLDGVAFSCIRNE